VRFREFGSHVVGWAQYLQAPCKFRDHFRQRNHRKFFLPKTRLESLNGILQGLREHYYTALHGRRVKIKDIPQYQHHEREDSVRKLYADHWPVRYQQLESTGVCFCGEK
jgi:hypothetical protein